MAAASGRAAQWGLWGCATAIIAIVLMIVVVAATAYLDLGEPESEFPGRLAQAVDMMDDGDQIDISALTDFPWDTGYLFAPGETTAAEIDGCLGFAWDKAELLASHLSAGKPGGFVFVADTDVVAYGWGLVRTPPVRFLDWPCGIAANDAKFTVLRQDGATTLAHRPASEPPTIGVD